MDESPGSKCPILIGTLFEWHGLCFVTESLFLESRFFVVDTLVCCYDSGMNNVALPRETNLARILSQYSRSLGKAREASALAAFSPNKGTRARRIDRIRAAWAMSRKVRFVRIYNGKLAGAAKMSAMRKAAREYRHAILAWRGNYVKDSGW